MYNEGSELLQMKRYDKIRREAIKEAKEIIAKVGDSVLFEFHLKFWNNVIIGIIMRCFF